MDDCAFPQWLHWKEPTENVGRKGGLLTPQSPEHRAAREVRDLEVWLMLSDLEHHANWGVE